MTDKEYAAFLEDTDNNIISAVDCCESISDLLKVTELKMMIAKELHEMNDYYDPADYDGLTDEEIAAMRKDTERDRAKAGSTPIWTSKTKLGYTPIFIGKSGAVYVGGVKLEGVRFAENTCKTHGINTLCMVFDTDRVVDMREKERTALLEPDTIELKEVLERIFR